MPVEFSVGIFQLEQIDETLFKVHFFITDTQTIKREIKCNIGLYQ